MFDAAKVPAPSELDLGPELLRAKHFTHKVGALADGNDIESGQYTLEEAKKRCSQLPMAVGFTHPNRSRPEDPACKVMCYFKSSATGNTDPKWQKYFKTPPDVRRRSVGARAERWEGEGKAKGRRLRGGSDGTMHS